MNPLRIGAGKPREPRSRAAPWIGGLAVLLVFGVLIDAKLWRPDVWLDIDENVQIAEAEAWWNGRLDLPERKWDTALRDGRVYSYFPPMFTVIAAAVVPFSEGIPHQIMVAIVFLVPLLAYVLFLRVTGSVLWGATLAVGLVCGTSALPVLGKSVRGAAPYQVNHTISTIGLLLILVDYFGRRRVWPACLGLALTALSRQLTAAYLLPIALMSVRGANPSAIRARLAMVAGTCAVLAVVYGGLNTLKFGSPLNTGYMLNHEGRDDVFAHEARAHGLLSLHWVPRNLYYTNVGPWNLHRVEVQSRPQWFLRPNTMGTGIWWTTPLLLWCWVDGRRLIRDQDRLVLLASAGVVFALLMFWHATGAVQRGFNRYSLDYLPVIFALIAPACLAGWRRWVTLAMIAWGVAYFAFVLRLPHMRVW